MKVCVIPAGGLQKRWDAAYPKHLVDINGEPLLARLFRQLEPHFDKLYILAWREEIKTLFPQAIEPSSREILHQSLLSTVDLWGDRTVFVYGDSVMSDNAVKQVVSFDGPVQFFGHYSEVMAISFDRTMHQRWVDALTKAITWSDRRWATYRCFWGMPMAPVAHDGGKKEFTHFGDWSTDVDETLCLVNVLESIRVHGSA